MGFNGPVDINHMAVDAAIRRENIRERKDCFDRVVHLAKWWIDKINNKDIE